MSNPTDDVKEDLDDSDDFVQIYMITLDIIRAYDLEKADTFGKSDPYCKVSAFSTTYTTCTIMKTLNPKWNEHAEMTFFNDPKALKFEVFDYDGKLGGKDDAIGECQFNIQPNFYQDYNGFSGTIPLENCKSGELEIRVFARKLLPLELEKKLSKLQDTIFINNNTISTQDAEIPDLNNKNATLENEINGIGTNINGLNVEIPTKQTEQKNEEKQGEKLDEEDKEINIDINGLESQYIDIEKEEKEVIKELEDIRIAEDKKNTENEHLQKDISDLIKQIEDKQREERERKERETAAREAKEKSEKEKLKQAEENKQVEEVENFKEEQLMVQPQIIVEQKSDDNPEKPLVSKDKKTKTGDTDDDGGGGCLCCSIL